MQNEFNNPWLQGYMSVPGYIHRRESTPVDSKMDEDTVDYVVMVAQFQGALSERNLLREALRAISPNHPALVRENRENAYIEGAASNARSNGLPEHIIRSRIIEPRKAC